MSLPNGWEIEVFKAVLALGGLLITYFFGYRVVAYWDRKKKRSELDLETARQFHQLYGEFKAVMRLWKVFYNSGKNLEIASDIRGELLKRAAAAEGGVEAIIMKLAAERKLNEPKIETLGLFRQAYQELRAAIRDNTSLDAWSYKSTEYFLFNNLASQISYLISSDEASQKSITPKDACDNLYKVTSVREEEWKKKIEITTPELKKSRGEQ